MPCLVLVPPLPYLTVSDNSRNARRTTKRKLESSSRNNYSPHALQQVSNLLSDCIQEVQTSKSPIIGAGDIDACSSDKLWREPTTEWVAPLSDVERSSVSNHIFPQQPSPFGKERQQAGIQTEPSNRRMPRSSADYNGSKIRISYSRLILYSEDVGNKAKALVYP